MALPFLFRFVRACPRIILEEVWARGRLDSQSANPVPCAGGSGRRKVLVSQGLGLATKPHCQYDSCFFSLFSVRHPFRPRQWLSALFRNSQLSNPATLSLADRFSSAFS